MSAAFEAAIAEFKRLRQIEMSHPAGESGFDEVVDNTTQAFKAFLAVPSSSAAEAIQKIDAAVEIYDVLFSCPGLAEAYGELRAHVVADAKLLKDVEALS